ncbi:MAG: SWIM zinc finger family protein [Planctomycetes bacterium]|nr:SWIM zinc finger family protein [Planctomycetota bacterium]
MAWRRGYKKYGSSGWAPYVPVGERRAKAKRVAETTARKDQRQVSPVVISGRQIASTFWGKAWCQNLERYSDYSNRLPRGRTYVRSGAVVDLQISQGKLAALVAGSRIYQVEITISPLAKPTWEKIKHDCSRSIDSLLDLLRGKFDQAVMERLTQKEIGLFPHPREIKLSCSCPDWADCCKHIAAVMYGVGARLDTAPEMLFTLRGVDHLELISQAASTENIDQSLGGAGENALAGSDLGELFGIELDVAPSAAASTSSASGGSQAAKPVKPKAGKVAAKKPARGRAAKASAEAELVTEVKTKKKAAVAKKPKKAAESKTSVPGQKQAGPTARAAARSKRSRE